MCNNGISTVMAMESTKCAGKFLSKVLFVCKKSQFVITSFDIHEDSISPHMLLCRKNKEKRTLTFIAGFQSLLLWLIISRKNYQRTEQISDSQYATFFAVDANGRDKVFCKTLWSAGASRVSSKIVNVFFAKRSSRGSIAKFLLQKLVNV